MKVHFESRKNYLPRNLIAKFELEAPKVYTRDLSYLEKWFLSKVCKIVLFKFSVWKMLRIIYLWMK
jgi:hypothetical protein